MNLKKYRSPILIAALVLIAASIGLGVAVLKTHEPEPASATPQIYLSLFQLQQKEDFQGLRDELSALQPFGAALERKFNLNPARLALAAADRKDETGTLLNLEELVILDIQDRFRMAEAAIYASPERALEALHIARLNYQVLSLFAPQQDPVLNEEIKKTFLVTMMSVKTEGATPALLKSYTSEIQSKLRQMYPGVRLAKIDSSRYY